MNNPLSSLTMSKLSVISFALGLGLLAPAEAQTTMRGEPFGYVRVNVAAGLGTAKRTTMLSLPLVESASINGAVTGRITGLSSNTITSTGAGWTAGQLSAAATPHLIEITSGVARGRMLLLSTVNSNTTDTVTVDRVESARVSDLRSIGIRVGAADGDTFRLRPVDTLSSVFGNGTEGNPVIAQGGATATAADTIKIDVNGTPATYFYRTNAPARWTLVGLGSPDASHVRIPPYAGVMYERLPATALSFLVTGRVPAGQRQAAVKNSGNTLLSSYWPVPRALSTLGLQNLPGWARSTVVSNADTLVISFAGSSSTYFHNGTNWVRNFAGSPNANATTIPLGASMMVNRRGSAAGFTFYRENAPYTLP